MHYTSIENIHKVIDPLFLDDLKEEFEEIKKLPLSKTRENKLKQFQEKISGLNFLDPACGSGNFLTETYISLRKLENEVLYELRYGQMGLGEIRNPIKVSIGQFYGIEINDFATTVAKTALWIAESQMMKKTEDIIHLDLDFLLLKTYANIVEGNALRINWEDVIPKEKLNYIMGNPPFVGARLMSQGQKEDLLNVFGKKWKNAGNLDFVACWYKKAADLTVGTNIRSALVSTNSITQGEQVPILWKPLFENGLTFDFAYKTFRWDSESNLKAHVHCVIICFSYTKNNKKKKLYSNDRMQLGDNINGYLLPGANISVGSRTTPLCDIPKMSKGSQPTDGGNLLLNETEAISLLKKYSQLTSCIKPCIGADEYINNKKRYCLWFKDISPSVYANITEIKTRLEKIKNLRMISTSSQTRTKADIPYLFTDIRQPDTNYLIIPSVSSEQRKYIPIGFMTPDIIATNLVLIVPNATLYHFGILTSNVHMAWMRAVCGRLEMRYRYSKDIVYNNFPWCNPTDEQKAKIEKAAQGILNAREKHPDSSLADLYNDLTMPPELRKAHQENDKMVMEAYGFKKKDENGKTRWLSESETVAELMKMYQELTK